MIDPRLNSMHFELDPRRQEYRLAREQLLAARGWMTRAFEKVIDLAADSEAWPDLLPIRPEQVLPGTKFLLVDSSTREAYPLRPGLNTIGRLPDNDIVLDEIWISRRHCVVLIHSSGQCVLHDTASRNGTSVNGERIEQPIPLHRGDRIGVSKRFLTLVMESDCQSDSQYNNHPETAILD